LTHKRAAKADLHGPPISIRFGSSAAVPPIASMPVGAERDGNKEIEVAVVGGAHHVYLLSRTVPTLRLIIGRSFPRPYRDPSPSSHVLNLQAFSSNVASIAR